MYNICITKNMDRFSNNGTLTYPMNSLPTPGRNKVPAQPYNSLPSNVAHHHRTPFPCYRQTQAPEQVPLDWNIPFLPEISSGGFSAAPQSYVQDLNSALPAYNARIYQNGTRATQGADPFYFKNLSGWFLSHLKIIHLQLSWHFHECEHVYTFWRVQAHFDLFNC